MFDHLLTTSHARGTEWPWLTFFATLDGLSTLGSGEFPCTPERICSRDLPAAGAKRLRNVAYETAPASRPVPADFLRSPERWGNPGPGQRPSGSR